MSSTRCAVVCLALLAAACQHENPPENIESASEAVLTEGTSLTVHAVRSIAKLRALTALPSAAGCNDGTTADANCCLFVMGYYERGDGGGGSFCYKPGTGAGIPDNGGTVIKPTSVALGSNGRWYRAGTTASSHTAEFNVRWFGAKGTGVSTANDRAPIQNAILAAKAAGGGKVYLPRGKYYLAQSDYLVISESNTTLEGDGASSQLFVDGWGDGWISTDPALSDGTAMSVVGAHIIVANPTKTLSNVHLRNFAFVGTKGMNDPSPAQAWSAMQIGWGPPTGFVVNNSGFSGIHAEKNGGVTFFFNGGANGSDDTKKSMNNYVLNSTVVDSFKAANAASGGHAGTVVCENRFERLRDLAIEWAGSRALICNNVITRALGGAIGIENESSQTGWSIILGNTIIDALSGISLGQGSGVHRAKISNNVIRDVQEHGIRLYTGNDVVIENNVVDGFGLSGSGANAGVQVATLKGMGQVRGNYVRCRQTTPVSACTYGFNGPDGNSENIIVDGNSVSGVTNAGGTAMLFPSSIGANGTGKGGDPQQTAVNVFVGRNQDLDTGRVVGPSDFTNTESIPMLQVTSGSASIAGSEVWEVNPAAPVEITALTEPTYGKTVTLLFLGPNPTTIHADSAACAAPFTSCFRLAGDLVSVPNKAYSMTLAFRRSFGWVEVNRALAN